MLVPVIASHPFVHDSINAHAYDKLYLSQSLAEELERKGLVRIQQMDTAADRVLEQRAPGRWQGDTVVILASGPSLGLDAYADLKPVRQWHDEAPEHRHVVAINTTFRAALWADLLYACDARWWKVYGNEVERKFKGERWCGDARMREWCNQIDVVDEQGLSQNPKRIHGGGNSGYQSIGLVYHFGVAKIVLLGFDMQKTHGKLHHHGLHDGSLPNLGKVSEWAARMVDLARDLARAGVRVINASRETAITCLDRKSIAAALAEDA